MSRIFDALRRSERERLGADGAELPQGPDLLVHAERRAASKWESVVSHMEPEAARIVDDRELVEPHVIALATAATVLPSELDGLSAERPSDALGRFQSLQISLTPQSRLVCLTDKENPTAEAIRLLGVRLRDLRRVRPLKKVLITSTIPQEGKSMIAANLACALAHNPSERTLLLEGDLRRPSLSRIFGLQKVPGMYEWLKEDLGPLNNIYRLEGASLWILPAGDASSNPIEYLQSPRLPALMDQIAAWFDWIIIDSPPVLPLADTSVWMRLADGALLVTRQGTTEKQQLQKGIEALDPTKLLGALVNGSIASDYSGYYYRSSITS